MKIDRFPYEASRWTRNQPDKAKQWFEELEALGPQNVRARLAQFDAGSGGAITTGSAQYLTIGFAQEWLAWHDRKREDVEAQRHDQNVFWTRFAALAATVAAAAAVIGSAWAMFYR